MTPTPFFSVIIPTLNEEKYLPRLLHQLLLQTDQDMEIIIVDAHSEDRTVEIVRTAEKKFPVFSLLNSRIRNVAIQRNMGAEKARGKFLVFFDADVQIPAYFLAATHRAITDRQARFLTAWSEAYPKQWVDTMVAMIGNIQMELQNFFHCPSAPGYCILIEKRAFVLVGGFRKDILVGEDGNLALRLYRSGVPLTILREPAVIFSPRRFHTYGVIKTLLTYGVTNPYMVFIGPVTKPIVSYPMGGQAHVADTERSTLPDSHVSS